MSKPFEPLNSDHLWWYFNEFNFKDDKIVKYYIIRIMKYYAKQHHDMLKKMIEDQGATFNKYFQEYDNYEKIMIAWAKDKHNEAKKC